MVSKATRWRRREAGHCTRCGREAFGYRRCSDCRQVANEQSKATYLRRRAADRCTRCERKAFGHGLCGACREVVNEKHRRNEQARAAKLRADQRCTKCSGPIAEGRSSWYCAACLHKYGKRTAEAKHV